MVLKNFYNASKWTIETLQGSYKVLMNPNEPIPPTKMHPRMMAMPWLPGEWLRMNSTRFMWQYVPVIRLYVFAAIGTYLFVKFIIPTKPRQRIMDAENAAAESKHERDHHYGLHQRRQDQLYFQKYDPKRKDRSEAYSLVYGGNH